MVMDTMENTKLLTEPWKPGKDFIFPLGMTSGSAAGNSHKQDVPVFTGARNVFVDQIKEDGIRKELYENERKARENWEEKWGFLKNPRKLWNKEAMKAGLPADVDAFDQENGKRKSEFCPSSVKSKLELPASDGIPKLSSGVIGWRSSSRKYDLNHVAGPLYLSRKLTMNPPLGPDEPDLRYQKLEEDAVEGQLSTLRSLFRVKGCSRLLQCLFSEEGKIELVRGDRTDLFSQTVSPNIVSLLVVALVITIGVITCVVSGRGMGGRPGGPAEPATAPMLALQPGMDRLGHELSAQRDRLVRLQSVQTDIALDLPPSIPLPDGEEIPYGSATRLQIRDPDQESEIYQKCIRPPPNRTVFDGESPPPYRSNSAGLLSSDWSSGSSSGSLVVRCHSVSGASSKRPANILGRTVRCLSGKRCHHPNSEDSSLSSLSSSRGSAKPTSVSVVVPSHRCRRLSAFSDAPGSSLASLPTVQCVTPATSVSSDTRQVSRSCTEELSRSHSFGNSCENRTNDNKSKNKCDRSTV